MLLKKNQPLCDIKGRVIISNIQALEDAMEKARIRRIHRKVYPCDFLKSLTEVIFRGLKTE